MRCFLHPTRPPRRLITPALAALLCVATTVQAQSYTADGAVAGGAVGAVLGGIIGHQNDETPEGILLGGAVGALTGGLMGNARDQQIARDHYYYQLQQQRYQAAASLADVVNMSRSGLGDAIIISHIQNHGVQQRLTTHDIISLHQQGVSEPVINALQNAGLGPPPVVVPRSVPPRTVIVTPSPYYYRPAYCPPPHHHYHHRAYHYRY